MINKRLIGTVAESKKYIAGNVLLQWCSLAANIILMLSISRMLAGLFGGSVSTGLLAVTGGVVILALVIRFICAVGSAKMGYLSSKAVKKTLREKIYQKLLRLGSAYNEQIKTSELSRLRWKALISWKRISARIYRSFSTQCWRRSRCLSCYVL